MNLCDTREVSVKDAYDVIVVGGGIGGIASAVAAARNGAKTLLMEKQINLGGLATVGLINLYEPLCDGRGKKVISGIAEEMIHVSIKYGMENLPANWGGVGHNYLHHVDRYSSHFSPTLFALALDEYVEENGVQLRFDAMATYPVMDGNIIQGIMAETVSGKEFYPCRFVIDATGDATICVGAGAPTQEGPNNYCYAVQGYSHAGIEEYMQTGDDCKLRKPTIYSGPRTGSYNADNENEFIRTGKKNILEIYKKTPNNSREIMALPTMPQYRKIRCIVGETTFAAETEPCADSIGTCGDWRKRGPIHHMPYRTLYNKNFPNLITAGRITSATGDGWEITRVIPVCALTGQAAGTAAAQCCQTGQNFATLDVPALQSTLKAQGVLF